MEFYSKKLSKKITLAEAGGNDEIALIDSLSLQDFMDNDEDVRKAGYAVSIDPKDGVRVSPDLSRVTIFGTPADNDHIYGLEVGEASVKNLKTDIAKEYPATMALKRLKDRCAIHWLRLDGADGKRIYSDNEIPDMITSTIPGEISAEEAEAIIASAEAEIEAEMKEAETKEAEPKKTAKSSKSTKTKAKKDEEISEDDMLSAIADAVGEEEPAVVIEEPAEAEVEIPDVSADTMMSLEKAEEEAAKFSLPIRGKEMTVAEIVNNPANEGLLSWFLKNNFADPKRQQAKELVQKILDLRKEVK